MGRGGWCGDPATAAGGDRWCCKMGRTIDRFGALISKDR
jgi:hypothetical protein